MYKVVHYSIVMAKNWRENVHQPEEYAGGFNYISAVLFLELGDWCTVANYHMVYGSKFLNAYLIIWL